jgi:predicted lactoylglutathione lyase
MGDKPSRKIFVNVAVRDLKKSIDFFRSLGFDFNQRFTDEKAACMVTATMLLTEPSFKTFTKRELRDTTRHTEALFALSCGSREVVDTMVRKAVGAGGRPAMDPQDHGFMYGSSFL